MEVQCNGCTACCKHDHVVLGAADDPMAYQWHVEHGYAVLDRKENGDCIYLDESGCSIHDRAPGICRRMDCRTLFAMTPPDVRARRERENPQMIHVYKAGEMRLEL